MWSEEVTCCKKEEEESVEGQADREVVDDCNIQVSPVYAAQKQKRKKNFSYMFHTNNDLLWRAVETTTLD